MGYFCSPFYLQENESSTLYTAFKDHKTCTLNEDFNAEVKEQADSATVVYKL